jgi:hypothetical protein
MGNIPNVKVAFLKTYLKDTVEYKWVVSIMDKEILKIFISNGMAMTAVQDVRRHMLGART